MQIRGYDAWRLQTPEEAAEAWTGRPCRECGAYRHEPCECREDDEDRVQGWRYSRRRADD